MLILDVVTERLQRLSCSASSNGCPWLSLATGTDMFTFKSEIKHPGLEIVLDDAKLCILKRKFWNNSLRLRLSIIRSHATSLVQRDIGEINYPGSLEVTSSYPIVSCYLISKNYHLSHITYQFNQRRPSDLLISIMIVPEFNFYPCLHYGVTTKWMVMTRVNT